jgi:hypothetical protein
MPVGGHQRSVIWLLYPCLLGWAYRLSFLESPSMVAWAVCKDALSVLDQSIQSNRVHQTEIYLRLLSTPHIDKSVSLSWFRYCFELRSQIV